MSEIFDDIDFGTSSEVKKDKENYVVNVTEDRYKKTLDKEAEKKVSEDTYNGLRDIIVEWIEGYNSRRHVKQIR